MAAILAACMQLEVVWIIIWNASSWVCGYSGTTSAVLSSSTSSSPIGPSISASLSGDFASQQLLLPLYSRTLSSLHLQSCLWSCLTFFVFRFLLCLL